MDWLRLALLTVGVGFTVTTYSKKSPAQPLYQGVISYTTSTGVEDVFSKTSLISPLA